MGKKASRPPVIFFDAQVLLAEKTGVGNFSYLLIERLARSMPDTVFVGHYFNFLGRMKPDLPTGANIHYSQCTFLPIQAVNLLRRLHIEIPIELRIRRKATAALFLNYLSAPSLFRTPGIGFIYDLSFEDYPEYVSPKNRADLHRFVPNTILRCARIVTISRFTEKRLLHYYPELGRRICILPIPPMDISLGLEQLPRRLENLGIEAGRYILYLGTLEPRKNIANLVRAYEELATKTRDSYALVIAGGKGWNDEELLSTIRAAQITGKHIILPGYVSDAERSALYQHAACFVLPSRYEGFGMPIFEAMQRSIPVAISDIPVFREVAGDAALYFDGNDPQDMARVLASLLNDDGTRQKLVAAGNEQLARFSWDTNMQTLTSVLKELR